MRAINLVNGTLRDELPPVRSVDELRRSRAHLEALGLGVGRDGILAASLAHFEELQAPVPTSTAEDMRAAVLGIVRQQHARRVGAPRDCPPSVPPAPPCRCCWHADFVGGARTKGQAGHDVDLLLWHHSEPNSWGPGAEQCLVLPLLGVLEASGRLLPPEEGRRQLVRRDHKAKQPDAATGERGYMKVKGPSSEGHREPAGRLARQAPRPLAHAPRGAPPHRCGHRRAPRGAALRAPHLDGQPLTQPADAAARHRTRPQPELKWPQRARRPARGIQIRRR